MQKSTVVGLWSKDVSFNLQSKTLLQHYLTVNSMKKSDVTASPLNGTI